MPGGDGGGLAIFALRHDDPASLLEWWDEEHEQLGDRLEELRQPARDRELLQELRKLKTDDAKIAWIEEREHHQPLAPDEQMWGLARFEKIVRDLESSVGEQQPVATGTVSKRPQAAKLKEEKPKKKPKKKQSKKQKAEHDEVMRWWNETQAKKQEPFVKTQQEPVVTVSKADADEKRAWIRRHMARPSEPEPDRMGTPDKCALPAIERGVQRKAKEGAHG